MKRSSAGVERARQAHMPYDLRPAAMNSSEVTALQSTAGNQAVQRMLDSTRFSQAGFRSAGLKPGFRLSGQSKFADLEDALTVYQAAKSKSEELAGLDRVEAACNAWLSSGYRTKKHSAAKATEEGQKLAEVTALLGDVQNERQELLSTMDMETLKSLDPDTGMGASIATLARGLNMTLPQLKATPAAALRQLYVAQVLQPFYIARKTGGGAGMAGQIVDVMFAMGTVDVAKLPAGDTRDILGLIQQSGLPDRNNLMQEYAPKYASGGVSTEEVKPSMPGWADTSTLTVTGNDDFRTKVKAMVPVIAGTAVGRLLLAGIGGEPDLSGTGHTSKKQVVAEIQLPKVTHVGYATPAGDPRYMNAGGAGKITFDPDADLLGKPGQEAAEPWRQREPVVALFHELIHVYLAKIGGEDWKEGGEKLHLSHDAETAEVRIVGIDYKVPKKNGSGEVTFPFSNPAKNPITENEFRKQLAAGQGQATYLPRSSYATVIGQVPLAAGPHKT